jgi:NOL1/NOP2/fmu family ribosome biogenesis protein
MTMIQTFLWPKEVKIIQEQLKEQFSIKLYDPMKLVRTAKDKIRFFTGSMDIEDIKQIGEIAFIETLGLYGIREDKSGELRLSIDATQILEANNNILQLSEKETSNYLKGEDIDKVADKGMLIIKSSDSDFLGCAKSTGEKLLNHIPKARRIRD